MLDLADIELLFARHGSAQYSGEPVTQLGADAVFDKSTEIEKLVAYCSA